MLRFLGLFFVTAALFGQDVIPKPYDMGFVSLQDIWVDPVSGSDTNAGASRADALQSIAEAWNRIPQGVELSATGYRIRLVRGAYSQDSMPLYWESRYGTQSHPVIMEASDGPGSATLGAMNVFDVRYFYLIGVTLQAEAGGDDVLHFEKSTHVLLRGVTLTGVGNIANYEGPQETLKVNQGAYFYVENSDVSGAFNQPIDFVGVQHGHVIGSRIHRAGDWCMYFKGGSSYFSIAGNEFFDCATGGFTAGQGSGLEFMVTPWLHYEAGDIKFVNNIVHDTPGAAVGVNGGYNVLIAHNTFYRVGQNSHVLEIKIGSRTCDQPEDIAICQAAINGGGWGPAVLDVTEPVPSRNVYVYNNVFENPAGYQSQWIHFNIDGPQTPDPGTNIAAPARSDLNLRIRGNIIWNGPPDQPLGTEDPGSGCQPDNPSCNATELVADNRINVFEPVLADPGHGDFHPGPGSRLQTSVALGIPDFTGGDRPPRPASPQGNLSNAVSTDRDGRARCAQNPPGAYIGTACASPAH